MYLIPPHKVDLKKVNSTPPQAYIYKEIEFIWITHTLTHKFDIQKKELEKCEEGKEVERSEKLNKEEGKEKIQVLGYLSLSLSPLIWFPLATWIFYCLVEFVVTAIC